MEPEEDIVNINFGEVGMYLPRSIEAIRIARRLLDMLEEENIRATNGGRATTKEAHTSKSQGCPQDSPTAPKTALQEDRVESLAERKDGAIASIPQEQSDFASELIPKFEYDKKAEKSYDNLFFFEHDDGRIMLSYAGMKTFTTKAAVMQIPFPIPKGYVPLMALSLHRRIAVRAYRKYLAEFPKDDASQRAEELRERAEINKVRWESKEKKEMSKRTKELRDGVVAKMVLSTVG